MAWTAPRSWVTGEIITAGMLNTHVRDNLLALAADSSLSATLLTAAPVTLTLSGGNCGYTDVLSIAPGAGTWMFHAGAYVDCATTASKGYVFMRIYNATDATVVREWARELASNLEEFVTAALATEPIVLAGTKTIKLQVGCASMGGTGSPVVRGNTLTLGGVPGSGVSDKGPTVLVGVKLA